MSLKTDYKDYIPSTQYREFNLINNANGTVSLEDVTVYTQEGDLFSAYDINQTNEAVNNATPSIYTITLPAASWLQQDDGTYYQPIVAFTVNEYQKVDFDADVLTASELPAQIRPYNNDGALSAVTTEPPETDITLQCTVITVQGGASV